MKFSVGWCTFLQWVTYPNVKKKCPIKKNYPTVFFVETGCFFPFKCEISFLVILKPLSSNSEHTVCDKYNDDLSGLHIS